MMPTRFILALPLAPSSMCPDSWLYSGTSTALRAAVGFGASGLSPPGLGLCSLIGCSGFPTWRSVRLGAGGGGELVAGWRVGRPVGVLPHWGVIAVASHWPLGTQPPLATRALNIITSYLNVLFALYLELC